MFQFQNLLEDWEKDDLEELINNYPGVLDMDEEEVHKLARTFYSKARNLYDEVMRLERYADLLIKYSILLERRKNNAGT